MISTGFSNQDIIIFSRDKKIINLSLLQSSFERLKKKKRNRLDRCYTPNHSNFSSRRGHDGCG